MRFIEAHNLTRKGETCPWENPFTPDGIHADRQQVKYM